MDSELKVIAPTRAEVPANGAWLVAGHLLAGRSDPADAVAMGGTGLHARTASTTPRTAALAPAPRARRVQAQGGWRRGRPLPIIAAALPSLRHPMNSTAGPPSPPTAGAVAAQADESAGGAAAGGGVSDGRPQPAHRPDPGDQQTARRERDAHLAALLAAAAAGDARAFESFYEATFAHARTVARRLLRDAAAIEDLLSDCYLEAWRTAARFDALRGSAVTWLLTLVRSRGLDALRAAAARPVALSTNDPIEGLEGEPDGRGPLATQPHGVDDDPADRLWRQQAGTRLHAALATLSAAERWVLGLAYLRELSHAEIARCTGMPLGTVKSHALRAQQKLRVQLTGAPLPRAGAPAPER